MNNPLADAQGPSAYQNWKAALRGAPSQGAFEVFFYSDVYVTGEIHPEAPHPYMFLNALPLRCDGTLAHWFTLRMEIHEGVQTDSPPSMDATDTSRYHGGSMVDEVAALVSLLMGIRVQPGAMTRYFKPHGDPRGKPTADREIPALPSPLYPRARLIQAACGPRNLNATVLPLFETYPSLFSDQAVALVRGARLYQNALWVAEAQPELCWLFLVSALEAVATPHHVAVAEASDVLQRNRPGLVELLRKAGGDALVEAAAAELLPLLRATGRFVDFVLQFVPPPPEQRPHENLRFPWDDRAFMKNALSRIYAHRSRALHDGTPFPKPMCDPLPIPAEIPPGLAMSANDGVWTREDTPMLLHVFEYITRGALLNWWRCQSVSRESGKGAV